MINNGHAAFEAAGRIGGANERWMTFLVSSSEYIWWRFRLRWWPALVFSGFSAAAVSKDVLREVT